MVKCRESEEIHKKNFENLILVNNNIQFFNAKKICVSLQYKSPM
jgi:hypothetical protein